MKVVDFKTQKQTTFATRHKEHISRKTKKAAKELRTYRKNRHEWWNLYID